jgi:hypothetical protein
VPKAWIRGNRIDEDGSNVAKNVIDPPVCDSAKSFVDVAGTRHTPKRKAAGLASGGFIGSAKPADQYGQALSDM